MPRSPFGFVRARDRGTIQRFRIVPNGMTIVTSETAAGRCLELEAMAIAVEVLEPGSGVRQADARLKRVQLVGRQPDAVVAHRQREQSVAVRRARDVDPAAADSRADAVAQRVLDERLEKQIRHRRIEHLGIDVDVDDEAIAESRLFDLQILLEEVELRP